MRILIAVVLMLPINAAAQTPQRKITREECASLAGSMNSLAASIGTNQERMAKVGIRSLAPISDGAMKDAVERAETARLAIVPLMSQFQTAIEDLAYQLRVCAR